MTTRQDLLTSTGPVDVGLTTLPAKGTPTGAPSAPGVPAGPVEQHVAAGLFGGEADGPAATQTPRGTGGAAPPTQQGVQGGAATSLSFTVWGVPIPQGSHRGFVVNGRAVITQANSKTKSWRHEIAAAAAAAHADRPQITGPVEVHVTFVMPRPKHHYRTGRFADLLRSGAPVYAAGAPDCDKLLRSLGDALTASAVIRDDAQIVVWRAAKVYADPGESPGAHVFVMAASCNRRFTCRLCECVVPQ